MKFRKKTWQSIVSFAVMFTMLFAYFVPVEAKDANTIILPTDVKVASKGCSLVGVEGKYVVEAKQAVARINEIRLEACKKGYPNPDNPSKKLSMKDYVEIKWSSELEYIAKLRAAEASVYTDHTRPNGKSCFSLQSPNKVWCTSEVLAWNYSDSMINGINQWYGEKKDWVKQNTNAVTGHYTSMIAPSNIYVGLGCFCSDDAAYYNTTAGRFSDEQNLDTKPSKSQDNIIQTIEVKNKNIKSPSISADTNKLDNMKIGNKVQCELTCKTYFSDNYRTPEVKVYVLGDAKWSSSNPDVASVSNTGLITANNVGTATITVQFSNDSKATVKVNVKNNIKKATITSLTPGKNKIKVTWKKSSGTYTGYQIQLSTKRDFKSIDKKYTVKNKETLSKTVKNLKSKKVYYVRVRLYSVVDGKKIYGPWSKVKSVKTK